MQITLIQRRSVTPEGRELAAAIALGVLVTLSVRLWSSMSSDGIGALDALWSMYRFFTVITNTLIGVVCALVVMGRAPGEQVQAALLLAIGAVSIVYHILLAHLIDLAGFSAVVDQMVHTVIPIAFALYWLLYAPKARLRYGRVGLWLAYPCVYCVYALARGAVDGIYPYPFLDIGAEGGLAVAVNVVALLAVFFLAGLGIVWVGRRLR